MEEVDTSKGTRDDGIDLMADSLDTDLGVATDMREDIALAQLDESELGVVAMCGIILESMASRA